MQAWKYFLKDFNINIKSNVEHANLWLCFVTSVSCYDENFSEF